MQNICTRICTQDSNSIVTMIQHNLYAIRQNKMKRFSIYNRADCGCDVILDYWPQDSQLATSSNFPHECINHKQLLLIGSYISQSVSWRSYNIMYTILNQPGLSILHLSLPAVKCPMHQLTLQWLLTWNLQATSSWSCHRSVSVECLDYCKCLFLSCYWLQSEKTRVKRYGRGESMRAYIDSYLPGVSAATDARMMQ